VLDRVGEFEVTRTDTFSAPCDHTPGTPGELDSQTSALTHADKANRTSHAHTQKTLVSQKKNSASISLLPRASNKHFD
jgi:hypothetical protein